MKQPFHIHKAPGKGLMVAFESETVSETWAGNLAIDKVLKQMKFHHFHQISPFQPFAEDSNHAPGFHAWEVWSKVTEDFLTSLIPYMKEEAAKNMELY